MSVVQERIPVGNDIVLVPVEVLVCQSCGERFYDRATMHRLEELEPIGICNSGDSGMVG
jgi:YgiT-type zinc finger domain-containing protein